MCSGSQPTKSLIGANKRLSSQWPRVVHLLPRWVPKGLLLISIWRCPWRRGWGSGSQAGQPVPRKKQTKTQESCCRRDTEGTRKLLTVMESLVWKKAPVQNPFITINPVFWGTTYSCTQSMATHHKNFTFKGKPRSKIFRQASEEGNVDLLLPKK